MQRLPLFPLPVVLFPGAFMPLHIFEERYRRMVADCLADGRPFGLLHHEPDDQGPFLSEAGRVGTLARIEKHHPLPDGRSMILVKGESRFSIAADRPMEHLYYEADVVPYVDDCVPKQGVMADVRARTLELFLTVVEAMPDFDGPVPEYDLNLDLSFQIAPTIQIDARWQHSLLSARKETDRLERIEAVLQAALEHRTPDDG